MLLSIRAGIGQLNPSAFNETLKTHTLSALALTRFGPAVLQATDVPKADAALLADSLVTAELWGHASHGMLRLPWYVARLRNGAMVANSPGTLVMDNGAVVVIDGQHGIGQVLTDRAVKLGVERACQFGISAVGARQGLPRGRARA